MCPDSTSRSPAPDGHSRRDASGAVTGFLAASAVAQAADAWLARPDDVEAYRRLCESVSQWRAWRNPTLIDVDTDPVGEPTLASPELVADALADVVSGLRRPPSP